MTELQIFEQLKRKYDAEMVSALVGAGFTKNAYVKALSWSGLLMDLVEDAYEDELQEMYQRYTQWKMEKCIKIRKSAFFFGKWLRFTKKSCIFDATK